MRVRVRVRVRGVLLIHAHLLTVSHATIERSGNIRIHCPHSLGKYTSHINVLCQSAMPDPSAIPGLSPTKDRGGVGVRGKPGHRRIFDPPLIFRGALPKRVCLYSNTWDYIGSPEVFAVPS